MRVNGTSFCAVACSLLVPLSCSEHETRPSPRGDSAAGSAGEIAGQGGATDARGNTGLSQGGAGDGGEMPTPSGAAGSEGGEAGVPVVPTNAGGAGGGPIAGEGGESGEGGANTGGEVRVAGAGGQAGAAGAAGAPATRVTAEQRALCESICAKEPLTNGFAGAPTAPCPNDGNCAEWVCGDADAFGMPNETCMDAFTEYLSCWDSLPVEAYECSSHGPVLGVGCANETATLWAVCS